MRIRHVVIIMQENLVVLEANTIVVTILGTHIPSLTGSCMIHPGLSPLIFATTKTLQSVN